MSDPPPIEPLDRDHPELAAELRRYRVYEERAPYEDRYRTEQHIAQLRTDALRWKTRADELERRTLRARATRLYWYAQGVWNALKGRYYDD
jgi:hypothetical protein